MISEHIIKETFIIDALKDAVESAFKFQLHGFNKKLKNKSGATIESLMNPKYILQAGGSNFVLSASVTKQLRLQDLGVRRLYTRPLWGALRHTYGRLQYGLTDDIRKAITEKLEKALNQT